MSAIILITAIGFIGVAWCIFSLVRNDCVCRIRHAFIDDDALWPCAYDRLPSYDDMLYSPCYWHLWTKQQWIEVAK